MAVTEKELAAAKARAEKIHDTVCDTCYDESRMNADGTCGECQDDYHELEILAR